MPKAELWQATEDPWPDSALFPGFDDVVANLASVELRAWIGGNGPPLLLLHGYPQTRAMWHRVAPGLARHFRLVIPDLRGYGASSTPADAKDHLSYSKRTMAADMAELMTALGAERFAVAGHDRGGRVAHRLCLDYADRVLAFAALDIVPTLYRFETVDMNVAMRAWHWFFLAQGGGIPEKMIAADPDWYLRQTLNAWAAQSEFWDPAAYACYLRSLSDPATLHATCEDYRASAGIDLDHDRTDRAAGRRIACPVLVLRGETSPNSGSYRVEEIWRSYAADVSCRAIASGHFPAEEAPQQTTETLIEFFATIQGRKAAV